ncbi:hypothetical protein, partial [uncultured Prevotella sp.]|uniref:hypothetical protein n=1 Tax=uncultured Prevotella sp. TaxID=159272 RepID=UPI0027E3A20E
CAQRPPFFGVHTKYVVTQQPDIFFLKASYQGMKRSYQGMKRSFQGMIRLFQGAKLNCISRSLH